MDQVKFVEDSLQKIWSDMVYLLNYLTQLCVEATQIHRGIIKSVIPE